MSKRRHKSATLGHARLFDKTCVFACFYQAVLTEERKAKALGRLAEHKVLMCGLIVRWRCGTCGVLVVRRRQLPGSCATQTQRASIRRLAKQQHLQQLGCDQAQKSITRVKRLQAGAASSLPAPARAAAGAHRRRSSLAVSHTTGSLPQL